VQEAPAWQQSDGERQEPVALPQQVPWAVQLDRPLRLPQQSLPYRQRAPAEEHSHRPLTVLQAPPQHCGSAVQTKSLGRQQVPPTHWSLPQQLPTPEQVAPSGVQQ